MKDFYKRRNLSGIYIIDKFPEEDTASPTCIEDCRLDTRLAWLRTKSIEYLKEVVDLLNKIREKLLEFLTKDERRSLPNIKEPDFASKDQLIKAVNDQCEFITSISDTFNIIVKRPL